MFKVTRGPDVTLQQQKEARKARKAEVKPRVVVIRRALSASALMVPGVCALISAGARGTGRAWREG